MTELNDDSSVTAWDKLAALRLLTVQERFEAALNRAGRPLDSAVILGVSKTFPAEAVAAFYRVGLKSFGESYMSEARAKLAATSALLPPGSPGPEWHFIGHLQTNKAKYAARDFDFLHSLDQTDLAAELNRKRLESGRPPLPVLVQVNVSGEASKSGLKPERLPEMLDYLANHCPGLWPRGLMTMPPYDPDPEKSRPFFRALRNLKERLCPHLPHLSMGMSGDYEVALAEGATIVRIGTALFGSR